MSKAGKFIPGGAGRKTTSVGNIRARTGPIRAPEEPPEPGKRRLFAKGAGLMKPVPKNRRIPITMMSAAVSVLLFGAAYYFAYLPEVRRAQAAELQAADAKKQLTDLEAAADKAKDDAAKHPVAAHAALTVDTSPAGATVTVGNEKKTAPASFDDLVPGKVSLLVQSDGYDDYQQDVTVSADKPTDLGTISLVKKSGILTLTCAEPEATYTITGPAGYTHDGKFPEKLESLTPGDYQIAAALRDWKLAPVTVTVLDQKTVPAEIKFPYASLSIVTVPPGAMVRNGKTVLGVTPLTLPKMKPTTLTLSVDLAPYTFQRFDVTLPDFGAITKQVTLVRDRDILTGGGIDMVWIPEGNFWASKYLVTQGQYEAMARSNPSTFRRPNRPVETITWEAAMAFCEKLNAAETQADRLPKGYRYSLPTESQWSAFSADADIDQAAMSRGYSLSSTQDVGASEPNKYGLYDTLGNVWEWCLDQFDSPGTHSLRGGGWLSSAENFPNGDTRIGASAAYADRFTGFRVVLVPQ